MTDDVTIDASDGVMRILMNRPAKKNALTGSMYDKMTAAMKEADAGDDVRAIVLEGAGGNFTAGNDVSDFLAAAMRGEGGLNAFHFIMQAAMSQTPIVAAVDGFAVGVGTTIVFHCDLAYATAGARFHMPFVNLGLVPEAGSSLMVPQRFGMAKASEYILLAEPFGGQKAMELGLVNAIVAPEDLSAVAMAAARKLAGKPVGALKTTRALLRGDRAELKRVIETEAIAFEAALKSPEARAAFMAFLSKSN